MNKFISATLAQLRAQRMLSVLGIVGTALSIFLIMVVVVIHQVKVLPFVPESNRDRMLHLKYAAFEAETGSASGNMSYSTARALVDSIASAQAVSVMQDGCVEEVVRVPAGIKTKADMRATDAAFWQVFDFRFLHGKPYGAAAVEAGLPEAVISVSTARKLFGTENAVGREFRKGRIDYRVVGVVKDVSTLADRAYSQIWVPATACPGLMGGWLDGLMGDFSAVILAHDRGDFDAIRREFAESVKKLNAGLKPSGWNYVPLSRPYDQAMHAETQFSNADPDLDSSRRIRMFVYLVLLIVPAINLIGMTESRLRRRAAEIGVRRAFGCTRGRMFAQLVGESLVITVIAGIIGWIASLIFASAMASEIFSDNWGAVSTHAPAVSIDMLVQWPAFFTALAFCFILNFLSSSLPAWHASRSSIVDSINQQ